MAELVESIQEVGLLQPIVVRPAGEGQFELVMGERRWRAAQQAGLETIPAIVRETEDHDLLRDALLENLHRAQLNPLEEAAAYQQMLEDFGCTQEELATRIKRSRPQISNTIRLLRLPPTVQRRVAAGVLSAGHARALLAIDECRRAGATGPAGRGRRSLGPGGRGTGGDGRDRPRHPAAEPLDHGTSVAPQADDAPPLTDYLDTRVRVEMGRSKGRIVIDFATAEDLDRIVSLVTRWRRS